MFVPDRVNVDVPDVSFTTLPVPEITPDRVWLADDEYVSTADAPSDTAPAYVPDPRDPLPDTTTEPDTVRPPLNVFTPDNVNVPEPDLVNALAPAMTPAYVRVVPDATLSVPPPEPSEMPRFAFTVMSAVVARVPPLRAR